MVRTEALDRRGTLDTVSLSKRRARFRRRRRWDALREWVALAVTATAAVWLASLAFLTLVSR